MTGAGLGNHLYYGDNLDILRHQITLAEPTAPMKTEAIKAGFYETPLHGKVAKLQIITIDELFAGKRPNIPFGMVDPASFKKASIEDTTEQGTLF